MTRIEEIKAAIDEAQAAADIARNQVWELQDLLNKERIKSLSVQIEDVVYNTKKPAERYKIAHIDMFHDTNGSVYGYKLLKDKTSFGQVRMYVGLASDCTKDDKF